MQPTFRRARFGQRHELWPRQIGLQEFVRDKQQAICIAIEQMVATETPEVAPFAQRHSPFASVVRSKYSASASTSPTSSGNAKVRIGAGLALGRSARDVSANLPFSLLAGAGQQTS